MTTRRPTPRRIGIYGGTFNPIHHGHLRAAEEVAETLDLERVLFVPSATPPHKLEEAGDMIAPAAERFAWVQLATQDNPRFGVDAVEVERGGTSFLVDTLAALRAKQDAATELVFLVGSDAFAEMGAWRAPRELFRMAHYAVIVRPPLRDGHLARWLPEAVRGDVEIAPDGRSGRHRDAGTQIWLTPIAGLAVSSSAIRRRLQAGRSVRYLLPEPVHRAVLASGVYLDVRQHPGGRSA